MTQRPVTAIIVGAGHRAMTYAEYALMYPDELKIVGVAEPDAQRRQMVQKRFSLPDDRCFSDSFELAKLDKLADAIINGTMDHQHVETAVPLLELGYDMLLEKPFAVNKDEMERLVETVKRNNSKVMICHVLRYTPFYTIIKQKLLDGEIGKVINIQTQEDVSYHHVTNSYVRGKWSNSEYCRTSMLLAKSCHDVDIMMWMMSETKPVSVSSFGSIFQFKPEMAPEGTGERCMVDCPYTDSCIFSAKRIYLGHPDRWSCYVWQELENFDNPTLAQKEELLRTSPYGRCVYKAGNNVVDHQSVLVNFESGATGTHNMTGGAATPLRTIHIIGTMGEIYGEFENNYIKVMKINPDPGKEYDLEEIDVSAITSATGHGGGDENLTRDFIRFQRGEKASVSCTSIFDSVAGHETVFLADRSRENGGAVQSFDDLV